MVLAALIVTCFPEVRTRNGSELSFAGISFPWAEQKFMDNKTKAIAKMLRIDRHIIEYKFEFSSFQKGRWFGTEDVNANNHAILQ